MTMTSLTGASDRELLATLIRLAADDRANTAELLVVLGAVEQRRLYQPSHHSLYEYCVQLLRMSPDTAYKRIRVARTARRYPGIVLAIRDGRLHLSSVMLLRPYLRGAAGRKLLEAALDKSTREIQGLLAERFPRPDLPTRVVPLLAERPAVAVQAASPLEAVLPTTGAPALEPAAADAPAQLAARPVSDIPLMPAGASLAAPVYEPPAPPTRIEPLSPTRFGLQVTIPEETLAKLHYAQDLLSHALPSGEVAAVLDRALDVLIVQLEKQRFAATDAPRASRGSDDPRHIPAEVRRAVWKRDQGRCTKILPNGTRCDRTKFLQYEHRLAVAKGGKSTVDNVCLLCSEHNQQAADEVFGKAFMDAKRGAASNGRGPQIGSAPGALTQHKPGG